MRRDQLHRGKGEEHFKQREETATKVLSGVGARHVLILPECLFKKIRDTKGTFHAKLGSVKDRNGMDLTAAEDIKKRWQEYTEELYKKDLQDQDNHDGVITHWGN